MELTLVRDEVDSLGRFLTFECDADNVRLAVGQYIGGTVISPDGVEVELNRQGVGRLAAFIRPDEWVMVAANRMAMTAEALLDYVAERMADPWLRDLLAESVIVRPETESP